MKPRMVSRSSFKLKPKISATPSVEVYRPVSILIVDVLPAPLWPSKTKI